MVKECIKKCSICGHNGHNARSCGSRKSKQLCVKIFGFKIPILQDHEPKHESATSASVMRKCQSTPNMIACDGDHVDAGYVSDGHRVGEKKKGVPWTEDEHLSFLSGLQKLGKGDWKGISKKYVHSRTATQVASHAQKYFKRLNLSDKRNRRSSLFDMSLNEPEIKNSPPPEPPDGTKEIPKLIDNLLTLSMSQNGVNEEQADTIAKVTAAPLTAPQVLPYFSDYGAPNLSQMPYIPMRGMTHKGQIFPGEKSFPSVPMMYIPNPAYFYLPKSSGSQAPNPLFMSNFSQGPSPPMASP